MIKSYIEWATLPISRLAQFPEFKNLDAFTMSKFVEEDFDIHVWELRVLSLTCKTTILKLREKLGAEGFSFVPQTATKSMRGFSTSSHDRWYGPGSCPTHGGSGWEQVSGFAGQKG